MFIPGRRERAHRSAMKRMLERHDPRARRTQRVPVTARELERGFDCLGSTVAEERPRQSRKRRQPRRELPLQRVEEQVRRVEQLVRLRRDGRHEARVPVTQCRHADAGDEVEVRASGCVEETAAVTALEDHRRAPVDLQHGR